MKRKPTIPITTARATRRAQLSCIRAMAKSFIPRHVVALRALETVHGSLRRADARKAFDSARERLAIHSASCGRYDCDAAVCLSMALDSAIAGNASQAYAEISQAATCLKWLSSQEQK